MMAQFRRALMRGMQVAYWQALAARGWRSLSTVDTKRCRRCRARALRRGSGEPRPSCRSSGSEASGHRPAELNGSSRSSGLTLVLELRDRWSWRTPWRRVRRVARPWAFQWPVCQTTRMGAHLRSRLTTTRCDVRQRWRRRRSRASRMRRCRSAARWAWPPKLRTCSARDSSMISFETLKGRLGTPTCR